MARDKLPINDTDSGCPIPEDRRPIPDDRQMTTYSLFPLPEAGDLFTGKKQGIEDQASNKNLAC